MSPARKALDMNVYSGRFAARLRSLREKAELSHEQIAQSLNVSVSAIYRWESGENHPAPDLLPAIAKALKIENVRLLFPLR